MKNTVKSKQDLFGKYDLESRRYLGCKSKLLPWIKDLLNEHTKGNSLFDVFGGTGVVTKYMLEKYDSFIINDFLFSNNIIYKAFFGSETYDSEKLLSIKNEFSFIKPEPKKSNYFSDNFGGRYFSEDDAKIIGDIREKIENSNNLNIRERAILIASLIYSCDRIANTVGHYGAYLKKDKILDRFRFELINPLNTSHKKIRVFREDSNELADKVFADIAFIDPPYNARQYSRIYHVLETLVKWDKPELRGITKKPEPENLSSYSKSNAPKAFDDLVHHLKCNYIITTYNNTYSSKKRSSNNKISYTAILSSLKDVGSTQVFEKPYRAFNAGKTNLKNHKERVFITKVR